MSAHRPAFLLVFGFASLAALAAAFCSYDAAFYLKAFTSYFAYGRSFFQLYFFLGWAVLCFSLLALLPARRHVSTAAAVACIVALQAYSVAVFCVFVRRYGLALDDYFYAVVDGRFSVSSLSHTHLLKPAMVFAAELLGLPTRVNGDNGYPFYSLMEHAWFGGALALLVLTAAVLILALRSRIDLWREFERPGLTLAFVICSFEILKSALDGGPINPVTGACMGVAAGILAYAPGKSTRMYLFPAFLFSFAVPFLLPAVAAIWLSNPLDQTHEDLLGGTISNAALAYAFLAFLVLAVNFLCSRRKPLLVNVLVLGAALWIFRGSTPWYRDDYTTLAEELPAPGVVHVLLRDERASSPAELRDGSLALRRIETRQPARVLALYRELRLRPGIRSHAVEGENCRQDRAISVSAELRLIAGGLASGEHASPLFESFFIEQCTMKEWCTHRLTARLKGCVPVSKGVQTPILNRLTMLGATSFIYRNERVWNYAFKNAP